jgi:hypothetical protein
VPRRRLTGGENGVDDVVLGQHLQGLHIDGRLRQPHPLRLAAEAVHEIAYAPDHLVFFVARTGQGHDDMVVGLSQGRAVPVEELHALPVGVDDPPVGFRPVPLQPGEEGRAEIEAHAVVVVDDAADAPLAIENAGGGVRLVAFGGDALVPVVEGVSGILQLHILQPGVLAGGLVKVAMNADTAVHRAP